MRPPLKSAAPLLAGLTLAAYAAAPVHAQNVVVNGGFEGTLAPFTTTGNVFLGVQYPHTGAGYAFFESGTDTLSQTVNTVAGQSYTLTFFANTLTKSDTLDVLFNGASVIGGPGPLFVTPAGQYVQYSFAVTGTGGPTPLSFVVNNPNAAGDINNTNLRLDDVSLSAPVPEASTTASLGLLLALGLGGLVVAARRKKATSRA